MATRYWVGGAGSWSSTTKWSATSGGASGASVPIATDDVVFDANSGLVTTVGLIATVDTAQTCATLTLTPSATVGTAYINITVSLTVTGLFSMTGTAANKRYAITSTTVGLATNFIVGSASGLSDVDFRDLFVSGAAAPLSGTRIGDLRGVTGVTFSTPKTVYWNLAGAQLWTATGWAATSGGAPAVANFPLAQDTAVFDNAGSITSVTVNPTLNYFGTIDMSNRTSAMTFISSTTSASNVYGDWINGSGVSFSNTTPINFFGRKTQSITSAGKTFTQQIVVDTYGGTVSLTDALNIGTTNLTITNGTFVTNGFSVTAASLSSNNTNVRAINLGASTLTFSAGTAALSFNTSTNLTFNAGTSIINLSALLVTFLGGGNTFSTVNFTNTTATNSSSITGANTFTNLSFAAPSTNGFIEYVISANQTITGTFTCNGASAVRRSFVRSNTFGTQRILTCAAVSAQDCDFRDISIAGAAAPYNASSLRIGDCGGNSGVTFAAGVSRYWNLAGAQNWSAIGWSDTSGGTPNIIYFPLAQDTAVFNSAGSVTGTITVDQPWNIGSVDMLGRVVTTFPMTISIGGNSPIVYGGWAFGTGVTSSVTGGLLTFSGRGTQTITSNGISFGHSVSVDSISGTAQLADAFALTLGSIRNLNLISGTFDAVSFNVTAGTCSISGGTLKMGSGTWTLSGTGSVWAYSSGTLFKGTANIVLSSTSTTTRTFAGSSLSYNKLTIGGATGAGSTLVISGNNQFTELASTKTVLHTIDLGTTTQTFGAWTITGTAGNEVQVAGTATLVIAGSRVSGVDYLILGTTTVSLTSTAEFYAGANSSGFTAYFILTAAPAAVTRYWRGGTGTWDATTTTNWSATSGGSGGASVPTSADAVIFNSASNATAYTVTCTATQLRCASLTMAGPLSGNVTWAGTAPLAIHGNVTLAASGITRSYTGAITFTGSATGKTITTNGVSFNSAATVNGIGCGWTLGSAFASGSTLTITNGSFDTGNFALTVLSLLSTNTNDRTISFGSSTVTTSSSVGLNLGTSVIGLTFNCGTSTISLASTTFNANSQTFYTVSFASFAGTLAITGTGTFTNLIFENLTSLGLYNVTFSGNHTITGTLTLGVGLTSACRTFLQSSTFGTPRTLTANAVAAAADIDFRDIIIAGAAAPISGTRFGDCKGNSGITFPAGTNKYWNLVAGGNWNSVGWATSSGGSPSNTNLPLAQDTAWIESTGLTSGNTITMNANYNVGTINMSGRIANTMILATGTTPPRIYGDWINGSGCSFTGTQAIVFFGRGSQTITSAGVSFTQPFEINTPGGSVTIADAFSTSFSGAGAILLTAGTFNVNGQNVTLSGAISSFSSSNSNVRTFAFGSGSSVLTLAGSTGFTAAVSTNFTVTGTGTIKLTSASTKTFAGGSFAYTNITLDQGGAGQLNMTGNNTFGNITNSYGATGATTINFANTTTTVSQFTAAGTAAKLLTIQGTSAAGPATLIYSGGGNVNTGYLTINNVRGYPL
jgi:hypothetical protein